ncbi:MAG: class I SAM-dependent methyltransferase [Kordiimonadaceae bacterium]|jgi:2-polyprenyl-3-methyl-5-hydroxy-6-metoxy-1,4-benzoquinol methylase|nr:class I SAM-dependent methyltransferase [Kordiimonadaceae bacterium]MBT6035961.1 class I SAM-dependent methyltransferase [Kordiimonadaceae bacterium]MBT6330667.1 class I SAM-dependent methyltransferase [Kordiimonadaceae bacterium]
MSDDWDDYAGDWDANPGVIIYADHTFKTLTAQCDIAGLNVLDFGCGTGNLSQKMAETAKNIVALDTSSKMISILSAKHIDNITPFSMELSAQVIKDNAVFKEKFDLVTASSVFAFVDDFEETLRFLRGLLKPDGKLFQWDWHAKDGEDDFGFSKEQLEKAYVNAGFENIKITQPFSLEKADGSRKVIMCTSKCPITPPD